MTFGDGKIVQEHYLGSRYIDSKESAAHLPADHNTRYRVASISKLVTTIGAMQLVEAGKLDLQQDISDYFGFPIRNPHYPQTPITTEMLLNHTSSIRDDGDRYVLPLPYTIRDFFDSAGAFYNDGAQWGGPDERPSHFFTYANLNFGLVGTLIEILSGQRFDRYMEQAIFAPLGIEASFNVSALAEKAFQNLATLYRYQDGQWLAQTDTYQGIRPATTIAVAHPDPNQAAPTLADYEIGTNGTLFSPQGGLRISARDLATIALVLANGGQYKGVQLLQPTSVQQMLTPTWRYDPAEPNGNKYGGLMRRWGLGVHLITSSGSGGDGDCLIHGENLAWAGHSGDAYGLHSGLWFDPVVGCGLVYCIGGTVVDPVQHPGRYSSFYRWEEEILTALLYSIRF